MGGNTREGDPEIVWFLNKKQNQVQRGAAFSDIEEVYTNSMGNTTMLTVPAESGFLERAGGKKKVSEVSLASYHPFIKKMVSERSDWLCWCWDEGAHLE